MISPGLFHRSKSTFRTAGMFWKLFTVGVGLFIVVSPAVLHGQGPNAQDVTQSFFDQHKGADPTNPDRALTDKIRQSDVRIEQAPLPPRSVEKTVVDKKTEKQIRHLQQQKKDFIRKRIPEEKTNMAAMMKVTELDQAKTAKKTASDAWERTEAGRTLRKLEAEKQAEIRRKEKTEAKISTAPLPPRSY
jgi:hypothetical protein